MDRRTIFVKHIENILEETLDGFADLNLNLKSRSARSLIASEIMKKLESCEDIAEGISFKDKDNSDSMLDLRELSYIRKALGRK